jgi:hypothetical protein
MFKYLSLLLLPLLTFGAVNITSSLTNDGYLYDLDVQLDFNKKISTDDFFVEGDEGTWLFYETMTFKPSQDGWYTFDNYSSDIAVGNTIVNETQLLLYTDVPQVDYIIDEPWAFRTSDYGFGAGFTSEEPINSEPVTLTEFYGEMELTGGTEYIVVFTSFVPDAYGTLDVSIIGNDPAAFGVVPEPTSFALMLAFGTFMFVAIRQRNK